MLSRMREPGMVSMIGLRGLVQAASALGVDRHALLRALDLPAARLDADEEAPALLLAKAWQVAPELSRDPLFGLHAGAHAEVGTYDVLDYLFTTASTLGDACRVVARHYRLMTDISRVSLIVDGDIGRFQHWVPPDYVEPLRHAWDYFFSGSLKRIRGVLPEPLTLHAIHLMHQAPSGENPGEYTRAFGCEVVFGHPVSEFVFDARQLELSLSTANPSLHRVVLRHADELLSRLPPEGDTVTRARAVLDDMLSDAEVSLESVARRLGVSDRTLQRKLAESGLTYTTLVDRAREELAVRHLESGTRGMAEVAFRLGFSTSAAFSRAFQRWRGESPSEYQKRARARFR
jgi:AraC-like DNA-binding protein